MKYAGLVNCGKAMMMLLALTVAQQKVAAAPCPCDIYAATGTPCASAHSTVRALYDTYNGPLYQVIREDNQKTKDIYPVAPGGVANAASQDSFLTGVVGRITILYDQTPNGNHMTRAPGGSYAPGKWPDSLGKPKAKITVYGRPAYGIYMDTGDGYRNNATKGMPTGNKPEGVYWVISGKRYASGCCFDYGNAETNNSAGAVGTMHALYFGNCHYWGVGAGSGPWIMADVEGGLMPGGTAVNKNYTKNPSITYDYCSAVCKAGTGTYTLKYGNALSGHLTTIYDSAFNTTWKLLGAVLLGIGGDNGNKGCGTFFEGAVTSGRPTDSVDDVIQSNIVLAYGGADGAHQSAYRDKMPSPYTARYNQSTGKTIIGYTLQEARHVRMNIFDPQGRQIAAILDGIVPAGRHEAIWDAKRVHAGTYIWRIAIDGKAEGTGRVVIGK